MVILEEFREPEISEEEASRSAHQAANEILRILDRIPLRRRLRYGMSVKEAAEFVTEHYVTCHVQYMDERELKYGKLLQAASVLRDRVEELETEVSDLRKK